MLFTALWLLIFDFFRMNYHRFAHLCDQVEYKEMVLLLILLASEIFCIYVCMCVCVCVYRERDKFHSNYTTNAIYYITECLNTICV